MARGAAKRLDDSARPAGKTAGHGRGTQSPAPCGCHGAPAATVTSIGPRWYCATTNPGQETLAHLALRSAGFVAFLPRVTERRGKDLRESPLFPGYVFTQFDIDRDAWGAILRRPFVRGLLTMDRNRPSVVPVGVVESLLLGASIRGVVPELPKAVYERGARLIVEEGPFADHAGVCVWSDRQRVELLISVFGRDVPAQMDVNQVRPA